jgi:hypothetical protein
MIKKFVLFLITLYVLTTDFNGNTCYLMNYSSNELQMSYDLRNAIIFNETNILFNYYLLKSFFSKSFRIQIIKTVPVNKIQILKNE